MSISVRFTAEDLAAIDAAMDQLDQRYAKLIALDARDRQRKFKMGNKTEKFCREALNVLDKNRLDISAHEQPLFRRMGGQHSGAWEATVPGHVRPVPR